MSYYLHIKDPDGTSSEWKRYLKKHGYKSIMNSPEYGDEIFGKGNVEVTIWDNYKEIQEDPILFTTYDGRSDEDLRQQVEDAHAFTKKFKGKVYDQKSGKFLKNRNIPKKQQPLTHKELLFCRPGYVWVPGFYKHNGTYIHGFCRKKAH